MGRRGRLSITKIKVKTLRVGNNASDTPDIPDVPDTPDTPTVTKHTVTFNANGGTSDVQTIKVDDNSPLETIPSSSRTGYTFLGWFDEIEGGNQLSVNARITSDMTYYAHWNVNQYTITFNANGGEGGWSHQMNYGERITVPTVSWNGHVFSGWSSPVPDTVPDHDVVLTAQWDVGTYLVTFNSNGGEGGWSEQLPYGSPITQPTVTRTGYTFLGWEPEVVATVPEGGATYMAQWEINQYAVTFDANGGVGGTSSSQDYGTTIVAPTVTRTGYTFKGWSPNVVATVPANDVMYTAQWEINKYTVTFDANGGVGGITRELDYGSALNAPNVTRTGYTFNGWEPNVPASVPLGGATYTAQWQINQYTATFDANDGNGSTVKTQDYGTSLSAPTVTRTGYTFTSWSPSVPETMPASNKTYTAQWRVNQYTVTFDANGGTGGTSITQDYGTSLASTPTVSKTGYTFNGWQPEVPQTIPAENTTYTAQWTPIEYTISYDMNGHGEQNPDARVKYTIENEYTPEPPADVEGWTFMGWSPNSIHAGSTGEFTFTAKWGDAITRVKYTQESGLSDWEGNIVGTIEGTSNPQILLPTSQIPNVQQAEEIWIGHNVTAIGGESVIHGVSAAFYSCKNLISITIPESVMHVGGYAFYGCSWLTNITIPDSVKRIYGQTFYGCSGLTSVTIGNGVTSIGYGAFSGCSNCTIFDFRTATSVPTLENVTAFSNTPSNKKIIVPDSLYDSWKAASNWNSTTNNIVNCIVKASQYGSQETPPPQEGYTRLWWTTPRDSESENHTDLNIVGELTPESIHVEGHTKDQIVSVEIGENVTRIGNDSFSDCTGLTNITVGSGVTSIGRNAFKDCFNCTTIVFKDVKSIPLLSNVNAFSGIEANIEIIVPDELYDDWIESNNWSSDTTSIRLNIIRESGSSLNISPDRLTRVKYVESSGLPDWEGDIIGDITGTTASPYTPTTQIPAITFAKEIHIGSAVSEIKPYAFYNCTNLTIVTLPNIVTRIGGYAFNGCINLTHITIPDSVTSIGEFAFNYCSNELFDTETIPGLKMIDGCVVGCSSEPENLNLSRARGVATLVFNSCKNIKTVTFGSALKFISLGAFQQCTSLEAVHISDLSAWCKANLRGNPLSYAHNLYLNGTLVQDLVIPNDVTSIGKWVFSYCSSLTRVTIPDSVTSIGDRAFARCEGLTNMTIPNSVTRIGNYAFAACSGLTNVTIPDSVTSIGSGAFESCSNLMTVTIPHKVTNIENWTFSYCSGLTDVRIPDHVTNIGESAFRNCSGLTSVVVPSDMKSIGDWAFSGCSSCEMFDFSHVVSVPELGANAFTNTPETKKILVPKSLYREWTEEDDWSSVGNSISDNISSEEPEEPENPEVITPSIPFNEIMNIINELSKISPNQAQKNPIDAFLTNKTLKANENPFGEMEDGEEIVPMGNLPNYN